MEMKHAIFISECESIGAQCPECMETSEFTPTVAPVAGMLAGELVKGHDEVDRWSDGRIIGLLFWHESICPRCKERIAFADRVVFDEDGKTLFDTIGYGYESGTNYGIEISCRKPLKTLGI